MMGKRFLGSVLAALLFASASASAETAATTLALVGGRMIDGSGAGPVENAVLLIAGGRILAAGPASAISVPADAQVLDLKGATLLPGFLNAHIHQGFDEAALAAWAAAGVTTVRDLGRVQAGLDEALANRTAWRDRPELARLLCVGPNLGAPGGDGTRSIDSPDEARRAVVELAAAGVDAIKTSLEDGYAGVSGLPKPKEEDLAAVIDEAHARGLKVIIHITRTRYLTQAVAAGADQIGHLPYDPMPEALAARIAQQGIIITPTFTVFRNFRVGRPVLIDNLRRLMAAGGMVALGDDYGGGPGRFELGMPMFEIESLLQAGMSPLEIISVCTRNAAKACGLEDELGTLEAGKAADILVLRRDPLADLSALREPLMVFHAGTLIRDERTGN